MSDGNATPEDIRQMVQKTLNITINQNPEEIDQLARQIKETIQSLTEIDTILAQTEGDLAMAETLKRRWIFYITIIILIAKNLTMDMSSQTKSKT